ncbi:ETS- transcription factor Elf-3 [Bulinus truncatus]|nr:ETS- transcription factor Elf-3 [Bulinus truncatus]
MNVSASGFGNSVRELLTQSPQPSPLRQSSAALNLNYQNSAENNIFSDHCLGSISNSCSSNSQTFDNQDFYLQDQLTTGQQDFLTSRCVKAYRDPHRSLSSSSSSDTSSPSQLTSPSLSSPCSQEAVFRYTDNIINSTSTSSSTRQQYSHNVHPTTITTSSSSYGGRQHSCYTAGESDLTGSRCSDSDGLCTELLDLELFNFALPAANMNDDLLPPFSSLYPSKMLRFDEDLPSDGYLDSVSDSGVSRSDSRSSSIDEEEVGMYTDLTNYYDCYTYDQPTSDFPTENENFESPFESQYATFPPMTSIPSQFISRQYPDNQQNSPNSEDDGFFDSTSIPEDVLPDFKLLQKSDPRGNFQRRRCSSSPKEKKKHVACDSPCSEKERRKPGRKPGQVSNVLHLWEFMRDLLRSPNNQGIIEWISKPEGVFRVVNSTEVARLWGEKKKNKKKMTYEKLSRSLRYSRLEGYFSDLPKDKNYPKKLCFKFGPKSNNWH